MTALSIAGGYALKLLACHRCHAGFPGGALGLGQTLSLCLIVCFFLALCTIRSHQNTADVVSALYCFVAVNSGVILTFGLSTRRDE